MQDQFETLWQKVQLANILGQMVDISQTFLIISIKKLLKNTTRCNNSNA